jgi:BirA family biotin operon repressor/biotin-[acetyl-CoA-carboxylase] ligase
MQRSWLSPRGNIALSIILYPDINFLPFLIMIASLAVVRGIEDITGLNTQIKWPNDILIEGKKVCGILIENEIKGNIVAYSIVGIGINVSWQPSDADDITFPATGLEEEAGRSVSRVDVLRSILTEFERLYITLPTVELIYNMWKDRLVTLGKRVTIKMGDDMLEGIAESVDPNGALLIRSDDGRTITIIAGDVTLRDS